LSKIVQRTTFPLWSEFLILPFIRPRRQAKNARTGDPIMGRDLPVLSKIEGRKNCSQF
jgi:hypothetical protein